MEALPTRFYRSVSSYWRRRKYQRLEGSAPGKKTVRQARFGGERRTGRRSWKLRSIFRIRLRIPSPVRLLTRLRDAYVDSMLGMAGKGRGLSASVVPESTLLARRIPKARSARLRPGEFEQRLIFEIYKSLATYGEPAAY